MNKKKLTKKEAVEKAKKILDTGNSLLKLKHTIPNRKRRLGK